MSHESFNGLRKLRCIVGKALSKAPQLNRNTQSRSRLTCGFARFRANPTARIGDFCAPDADPVDDEGEKKVNIRSTQCAPVEVFSFSLYPLLITLLAELHPRLIL